MATGRPLPRVDLGHRDVPELQPDPPSPVQPGPSDLPTVLPTQQRPPVVPLRLGTAAPTGPAAPFTDLRIALVLRDKHLYELIKEKLTLISPPYWDGHVKLHIILAKKGETIENITNRIALTQLGLVTPRVARLTSPDQVTLGWPDPEENQ